jgi:hypothetical protein
MIMVYDKETDPRQDVFDANAAERQFCWDQGDYDLETQTQAETDQCFSTINNPYVDTSGIQFYQVFAGVAGS